MYRVIKIYLLILFLGIILSACGEVSTPTALPAASTPLPTAKNTASNLTTTQTPSPATAPTTPPQITPTCFFAGDFGAIPSLGEQIKRVKDIVQVQVTRISPSVWNTTDGKAPVNICGTDYDQFSSVEISITETYQGNLKTGSKIMVLVTGAPDSLKQGNYDYFPKMGELLVLFLGEEHNYRPTNLADPLISQVVWPIYHQETSNIQSWISQTFWTKFTLPELKDKIKNPVTEPTLLPLPPIPTPAVKAGQTLQPVTAYGLAKAKSTYQKGPKSKPELWGSFAPDSERFTRLVKALDQHFW